MTSETDVGADRACIATVSGELDAAESTLDDELGRLLQTGATRLVVDLTNVTFIDSSVIRALLVAHRQVTELQGWIRVVYTHHLIGRVIDICGLAEIFPRYASVDSALRDGHAGRPAEGDDTSELGGS